MYINPLAWSRRQRINQYRIRKSPFPPLPVCVPLPQVAPYDRYDPSPPRAIALPSGLRTHLGTRTTPEPTVWTNFLRYSVHVLSSGRQWLLSTCT